MKKPAPHSDDQEGVALAGLKRPAVRANTELAGFIRTTFSEWWDTKGFDQSLRGSLYAGLRMVKADAFVVKIAGRSVLTHCTPSRRAEALLVSLEDAVQKLVDAAISQGRWEDGVRHALDDSHSFAIQRILVRGVPEAGTALNDFDDQMRQNLKGLSADDLNYCVYVYRAEERKPSSDPSEADEPNDSPGEDFARQIAPSVCLVLFDIFRNREHRLAAFPKEISKRYWVDSAPSRKQTGVCLSPPWEGTGKEGHRTATLSIDLRRSTFCMEQADQGWQFGEWLDQLVKILTAVTHRNGGVFDKFTGDGALIHFLERESREVYQKEAVSAAVQCAVEMQEAVWIHLKKLRRFLRFDSEKFGAGVSIDVSEAFWSIDGGDSPIVVGRGVVGACRLGAGAQAGTVRLSNIAWMELDPVVRSGVEKDARPININTKEWSEEMGVRVWEFKAPLWLDSGIPEICRRIYDKTERSKPPFQQKR